MSDLSMVNRYNKKITIAANKTSPKNSTSELYNLQLENNKLKAYTKSLEKQNTKLSENDNMKTIKALEKKVKELTIQNKQLEDAKRPQSTGSSIDYTSIQAENKKLRNEVKELTNDLLTQHKQIEFMTRENLKIKKLMDSTHDDVSKIASVHKTNKKLMQELDTLKTSMVTPEKHARIEKELTTIKQHTAVTNTEVKETLNKMETHVNRYKNAVTHAHALIGVCVAYELAHGNKDITESLVEGRNMLAGLM